MIAQTLEMAAADREVTLAAFDAPEDLSGQPDHVSGVLRLSRPGMAEIAANAVRSPLSPLQCHLFNSASARSTLAEWAKVNRPEVVMADMIRLADYGRHLRSAVPEARIVLDMDDLLSDRYRQMRSRPGDILGSFASGMPHAVRRAAAFLPSTLLALESRLAARAESRSVRDMDAVVLVSGAEARTLSEHFPEAGARIFDVPPSVGAHPYRKRDFSKDVRIVFFGDETYAPNAEAMATFDAVARRFPGVRFQSAGRIAPSVLTRHVERLGFVDDLDAFLGPDAIMLAPIDTGTGIKTKLLDAFSRGVPVVATRKAIEGLDLVPGKDVAIAEGVEGFVDALRDILPTGLQGISEDARLRLDAMSASAHSRINRAHAPGHVRGNLMSAMRG